MDTNTVEKEQRVNLSPVLLSVSISWHNIQVFSRVPKRICRKRREEPKEIIRNGEVMAGQLLAIMGASGAGKTTLLNVLTARNLSQVRVKGVVRLNGDVVDRNTITSLSAYVQQEDLFIPSLTVREHLIFQSLLRMDQTLSKEERNSRIEQVINEFSLSKCAESKIGSSTTFKGISGGESKRLAFASEFLTNPSIMFCDEPTSGLDSFMAENIVNVLKRMSTQGRTIICTIHQPSSQVFSLFEQLLLMADGRVAFMGNLNNAIAFFTSLGYNIPNNYNPADFYIGQLAIIPGKEIECKDKLNNICDNYLNSSYAKAMDVNRSEKELYDSFTDKKIKSKRLKFSRYRTNCCRHLSALLWRSFLTTIREPMISQIRVAQSLIIALILGIVYWQQNLDQRGVMNMSGALFLLVTNLSFQNSLAVVNTFCAEFPVFLREHHNGMYRVDAYFLAKIVAELPVFTVIPTLFVVTYYYMVGFNPSIRAFLTTILIAILITNCAVSFGYLLSCVSTSVTMAVSLGPPLLIPLVLFGGFFLNNASIPWLLGWMKYISWFYYGFESLMINQWRDIENIHCETQIPNSTTPSSHCWNTGKDVIKQFDFDESHLIRNLIMLVVLIVVIRTLAFIALHIKSRKR